jgi:uncharacterized protein (TIGR00369 family)
LFIDSFNVLLESSTTMSNIQNRIQTSFAAQGLMTTLGAQIALVQDGEVHIALPFSKHLSQQHGYVHAGAITSLVDSACGYAAMTKAAEGYNVVTAEFKVNFMRPAIGERFLAVGKVQSAGKMLTVCTGEVRAYAGDDYKVIALMQATIVNLAG